MTITFQTPMTVHPILACMEAPAPMELIAIPAHVLQVMLEPTVKRVSYNPNDNHPLRVNDMIVRDKL